MKRIWSRIKEQWNEFWDDDEFDECKYHLSSYDKRSLLYWGFVISGFTLGICLLISGLSNKYYDRKNNEDLQKVFDTICTYLATATDDEYEEIAQSIRHDLVYSQYSENIENLIQFIPNTADECRLEDVKYPERVNFVFLNTGELYGLDIYGQGETPESSENSGSTMLTFGYDEISEENLIICKQPGDGTAEVTFSRQRGIVSVQKMKSVFCDDCIKKILQISDEVTIMRDGKYVATTPSKELTTDMIIKQMVGRDLTNRFPEKTNVPGEDILEIKDFTAFYQPSLKEVNFSVRKGEVFGIAGLVGAKRTEVLESIFGMRTLSSGHVFKMSEEVNNSSTRKAIKNGFALVTEERRQTGIFGMLSINFNSTIANIDHYKNKFGFLDNKKMQEDTKWVIDSMQVKTPSEKTAIQTLSGGNQQKVILGRWLLSKPDILMLDEPTRGIDVGAKYDIYRLIIDLATVGKAVIVVSSEMPELLGITDRIMVMSNGRVAGIVETKNTNQEEIMALSAKYL